MVCSDSAAIANDFVRLLLLLSNTVRRPARLPTSVKAQSRAFEVLFVLQNHTDKTVTMSQIAREARMSQQQLTKVMHPLEEEGLVRRERDEANRRRIYAAITPKGRQAVDALLRQAASEIAPGMEAYTPEERQELASCIVVLRRLLSRMS